MPYLWKIKGSRNSVFDIRDLEYHRGTNHYTKKNGYLVDKTSNVISGIQGSDKVTFISDELIEPAGGDFAVLNEDGNSVNILIQNVTRSAPYVYAAIVRK